jgi:hypothetical protein
LYPPAPPVPVLLQPLLPAPPTLMVKVVAAAIRGRVVTTRAPVPPVPVTPQLVPVSSPPPAPSAVIVTTDSAGTVKVCAAPVKPYVQTAVAPDTVQPSCA